MEVRPRVGVSSCLLGEEVRFNGGHKRYRFLTDELGPHVDWVPYCPEVSIGLGTPREPIRLTADGRLVNRRVWAEFGPPPTERAIGAVLAAAKVAPDGACVDAEGAVWIADAAGGRLLRVRDGGEILDEVRPGSPVYACALGGADGRTLYACVAPDFNEAARKAAREARLLAFRVPVPAF